LPRQVRLEQKKAFVSEAMKEAPIAMLLVEDNPADAAWIAEML